VVVIGFILLVPSVAVMAFLTIGFLGSLGATASIASASSATASLAIRKQVIDNMRYAAVPSRIINAVISGDDATVDADLRYVRSTEEVQAIKQAQADLRVAGGPALTGNALFGGMATFLGSSYFVLMILAFVSGLLGWLLVMKKRVLQCGLCGAVVNAS
jgi:hypothetical protein